MKTFITNRKKWGRLRMLNDDGTMCCLGFCAKSFGVTKLSIFERAFPFVIINENQKSKLPKWLLQRQGHVKTLSLINDSDINLPEKENKIAEIFLKHNIIVKFVG